MTYADAVSTLHEVMGRQYSYIASWGLSRVKEAIRTIQDRKCATDADRELADAIHYKIYIAGGFDHGRKHSS